MFRRRFILFAALLALAPARARAQRADTVYSAGWGDAGLVVGALGISAVPVGLKLPKGPPPCAPCDPASLWSVDRVAVHHYDSRADEASTLLVGGVVAGTLVAGVWGQPLARARGDVAVMLDAMAVSTAATEWLKVLVHRDRPILYTADAPAAAASHENRQSFPSGHATIAFTAAMAYAVLAARQHLPHRTRNTILAFAGATLIGVLRVAAAKHFPTDVAGGAVLGAGVGWLTATLHPTLP